MRRSKKHPRRKRTKSFTLEENLKMRIAVMKGDEKHLEERIARTAEKCTCGVCKKQFIEIWQKYFDPKSPLVRCPDCGDIYGRYSGFIHTCPRSKEENDKIYAIESERRRLEDASDEEIEQIMTQRTERMNSR